MATNIGVIDELPESGNDNDITTESIIPIMLPKEQMQKLEFFTACNPIMICV